MRDEVPRHLVEEVAREVLGRMTSGGPPLRGRVALGSDHAAWRLKVTLARYLEEELGRSVLDCGTHSEESVDYPDIAVEVGRAVASGRAACGIMLDGAGIGSAMVLNRIPGILAAVCHDVFTVRNSREHNNANVLVMGSRVVSPGEARRLVRIWLQTPFAGGRHARRVGKILALDAQRTPAPGR
jgi:ribose 5-phosphate isomerase B